MDHNPKHAADWQELLRIAQGGSLVVERVRIPEKGIAVEGQFTLPELARLSLEDQVFIVAFLRSHGSIKEMEQTFGVSYPTIKARLNRISGQLQFVETDPSPSRAEILARLKSGEISAEEAIRIWRRSNDSQLRRHRCSYARVANAAALDSAVPVVDSGRPVVADHFSGTGGHRHRRPHQHLAPDRPVLELSVWPAWHRHPRERARQQRARSHSVKVSCPILALFSGERVGNQNSQRARTTGGMQ